MADTPPDPAAEAEPEAPESGSSSDDARESAFTPGTVVADRYRIVALLGRGGMGSVYRADDIRLGQPVALKFVARARSAKFRERLYAEVRIGRQVSHPNVCRLYDVGEAAGRHFLAMEYVDGEDLRSLLARIGKLPVDKATQLVRDLCAGLAAVHEAGVVHRDLKPGNVMIDGRGRARITDFGLAVAHSAPRRRSFAGTPAYMAPEQAAGREVDLRSDLYSLGLIVYEMLTGERFHDARTVGMRLAEPPEARSARLDAASSAIPAALLRIVGGCLEDQPDDRPPSARALLACLPGGDPLSAAVAAGETPAPELVAAAATRGDLAPRTAWALLASVLAGLAAVAGVSDHTTLLGVAPPPKPSIALLEEAKDLQRRLGGEDEAAHSAWSFYWDHDQLAYIAREDSSRHRWDRLRNERPGPGRLFYRTSPRPLVAANRHAVVYPNDPPMDVPGMTQIVLDDEGRLLRYQAVPWADPDGDPEAEPDWAALLEAAGLGEAQLTATLSPRPAPVDTDQRRAWTGALPQQPDVRLHVQAASYRGHLVWFDVGLPWTPDADAVRLQAGRSEIPFAGAAALLLAVAVPLGGGLLARRNLRLGRGDREGGTRVALFVFGVYSLARLLQADHVASAAELWVLVKVLAYPALWAGMVWLIYVALEPYARRRWPHVLVSWQRLLSGRFGDPMVGRDVLIGCAGGLVWMTAYQLAVLVPGLAGEAPLTPTTIFRGSSLAQLGHVGFRVFVNAYAAVQYSLAFLFLLVLARLVARRTWLAMLLVVLLFASPIRGEAPLVEWALGAVRAGIMLTLLMRSGLLGLAVAFYVGAALMEAPLTLDPGAWYFGRAVPMLAVVIGLAVYGFRTALGGKPAFGAALEA